MSTQETLVRNPISAEALVDLMIKKWNDQPEKKDKVDVKEDKAKGNMDGKPICAEDIVEKMIKRWSQQNKTKSDNIKEAHLKALDDLVSVNSLFMIAVFVGLSMAARGQQSLETREECQPGIEYAKLLLLYEVVAFACFLLSSLVVKVIKLHLTINGERFKYFVKKNFDLKDGMLILAASSSATGVVLLTLSVVNIIEIRIGLVSCGSAIAWWAVCSVSGIVGVGLMIYVISMAIAIFVSFRSDAYATSYSHPTNHSSHVITPVYVGFQSGSEVLATEIL